jgi:hypothetical protein
MTRSLTSLGLLATALLLAGCASSRAATGPEGPGAGSASSSPAGPAQASSAMAMASGVATAAKPSATALMVCGNDIRGKVQQVLGLAAPPVTTDSFGDGRYSCSYRLPPGSLVLSVQQSKSPAAARGYFAGERVRLRGDGLPGLGEAAFGTGAGTVVVVKDNETLTVDATGMPAVFGSQQQKRTDLAYELASDVLGCWTGDGDE